MAASAIARRGASRPFAATGARANQPQSPPHARASSVSSPLAAEVNTSTIRPASRRLPEWFLNRQTRLRSSPRCPLRCSTSLRVDVLAKCSHRLASRHTTPPATPAAPPDGLREATCERRMGMPPSRAYNPGCPGARCPRASPQRVRGVRNTAEWRTGCRSAPSTNPASSLEIPPLWSSTIHPCCTCASVQLHTFSHHHP